MPLPVVAPMTPADLDDIMLLERVCFKDPWTRHMYLSDLTQNRLATYLVLHPAAGQVAAMDRQTRELKELPPVLAYGGFWMLVDEAHVATIASHPTWRGCGLGLWLMLALLEAAITRGARLSTLEVRMGNLPARALYEKLGYEISGFRRHYYRDGEDALIMTTPSLLDPATQGRLTAVRQDTLTHLENCFRLPTES